MAKLPSGKLSGVAVKSSSRPQATLGPQLITVASVTSKATVIMGEVGCRRVEIMLDSGSAVSLLRKQEMEYMKLIQPVERASVVKLVTAFGDPLLISNYVQAPVQVGNFKTLYHFVVVDHLLYWELTSCKKMSLH